MQPAHSTPLDPQRAGEHRRRGQAHARSGQWGDAANAYIEALACRPTDPELHHDLGLCFESLQMRDEAAYCFDTSRLLQSSANSSVSGDGGAPAVTPIGSGPRSADHAPVGQTTSTAPASLPRDQPIKTPASGAVRLRLASSNGNDAVRDDTALVALELPFLLTRKMFAAQGRNELTRQFDEAKWPNLDFEAAPGPLLCFWSGPTPGEITQLAMASFVRAGHAVHVYTYDDIDRLARSLPPGVKVQAAASLVPREIYDLALARAEVRYFSDIFRYAALYELGGWWVDTDVVLLRPLPAVKEYFFCSQWSGLESGHLLVGDVLYAPRGSLHMLQLYRQSLRRLADERGDRQFGAVGPKLLTEYVFRQQLQLKRFVYSPTLFNAIDYTEVECFERRDDVAMGLVSDERVLGVHLWNKVWAERGRRLGDCAEGSIGRLLAEHVGNESRLSSLALRYGSDKGPTHKGQRAHDYARVYDRLFKRRMLHALNVMEIGLCRGLFEGWKQDDIPSLRMWLDYFPNARIFGVDISDFSWYRNERVTIFRTDQSSEQSLSETVVAPLNGTSLDIVIDDGSHASWDQQITFRHLFPLLRSGGLYIIEDLDWQPPRPAGSADSVETKAVLENFLLTGRLVSTAWGEAQGQQLAGGIASVEFYDSYAELLNRGHSGGMAVIRRR